MIELKNIVFGYSKERLVLDDISIAFCDGCITSVLGPNGSGKTTMLKIMLGLLPPNSGTILINGKNINDISLRERAKLMAYVPQKHNAVFDYRVLDIVAMGRVAFSGVFANTSKTDYSIAMECLEKMKIANLADKAYTQISGGEQQMVLISRALAQQAKILILDEPVTGLDYGNQIRLLKTLKNLSKEGITCIKTTHYPEHALWAAGRAVFMKTGKVLANGKTEDVVNSVNLRSIYNTDVVVFNGPIRGLNLSTCIPVL